MSLNSHVIYSDETYLHGKVAFALGGLICSLRRAEILKQQLSEIRSSFGYLGELKWRRVSYRNLPMCERFVEVFLKDRFARFSIMKVTKGQFWNAWGKSEEERFFKSYYVFLKLNASPYSRYRVYPDHKCLQKHYRWNSLRFIINKTREEWEGGDIGVLQPLDSKREDLLQLTDLLLGCLTSNAFSEEKAKLRRHVVQHLELDSAKNRYHVWDWSPKIKKK